MEKEGPLSTKVGDSAIATLLCATTGVLLLETWCITRGTAVAIHLFGAVAGMALIALLLRRSMRFLSLSGDLVRYASGPHRPEGLDAGMAGKCLGAAGLGYAATVVLLNGWLTAIVPVAAILLFPPWSRIVRHRVECLACWAAFSAASAIAIRLSSIWMNPLPFLFVTYALWIVTLVSWMTLFERMRRGK